VVKLDVVHEKGSKLLQIAMVVGVEQDSVERREGAVKVRLRLDLIQRQHVLRKN